MKGTMLVASVAALILAGCAGDPLPAVTVTATETVTVTAEPELPLGPSDAALLSTQGITDEVVEFVEAAVALKECPALSSSLKLVMAYEVTDWEDQGDLWNYTGANRIRTLMYLDDALRRAECY